MCGVCLLNFWPQPLLHWSCCSSAPLQFNLHLLRCNACSTAPLELLLHCSSAAPVKMLLCSSRAAELQCNLHLLIICNRSKCNTLQCQQLTKHCTALHGTVMFPSPIGSVSFSVDFSLFSFYNEVKLSKMQCLE